MSNFDEIIERIKLATRTRTQIELAAVLDIRQSSISDAKRRNSIPSDWCMKLFERFGLSPDWIKKGAGPMYLRTEAGYSPVEADLSLVAMEDPQLYGDPSANSALVNVYSMQPGIPVEPQPGFGEEKNGHPVIGKLSIPLSLTGNGVRVFLLDSTGMEPLLRKGGHIGVDTHQKQVISGELYAVSLPYEGVSIRRVFSDISREQILLRAENPQHPEVALPLEALGSRILGRVVWVINKY